MFGLCSFIILTAFEFLYTTEGEFFFLEINTRIQVEHPVTEMVTGVDLVLEQIRIAAGLPLTLQQQDIRHQGHAIECRICAEDPETGFTPETGQITFMKIPQGGGLRFDSGIYNKQKITTAFDPMLAKLVVHGIDRSDALAKAKAKKALAELVILGVKTNSDFLQRILALPQFKDGDISTAFIENHQVQLTTPTTTSAQQHTLLAIAMSTDRNLTALTEATHELYSSIGYWRN